MIRNLYARMKPGPELLKTPFGNAVVLSAGDFTKTALPPLPTGITDFGSFMAHIREVKTPTYCLLTPKDSMFYGYSVYKPSILSRSRAFKPLKDSIQKIVWQHKHLKQKTWFKENTKRQWELTSRSADALPDGYLCTHPPSRVTLEPSAEWACIVASGAYQQVRSSKTQEENIVKVTHCMAECMMRDPRRRFTFGFTVEDESMRLWYCDRNKILASQSFDVARDPSLWFRFLLGCIYAEDHALGFDPTMVRLPQADGSSRYDITLRLANGQERIYRTISLLGNSAGRHLLGRGTRVWKAVEIQDGAEVGDLVALKDCWRDDHRQPEGLIYASVKSSAKTEQEKDKIDNILLSVIAEGDVYVAGALDQVVAYDNQEAQVPDVSEQIDKIPLPTAKSQIHYRIVFKEIGESLWHISSLHTAFRMLRDASRALHILHKKGYVHGDVNPGNILLVGNSTKITDLEYLREKRGIGEHDRICNRMFIPYEVRWHFYNFAPPEYEPLTIYDLLATPPIVFRYRPFHDLESLWWICVYFLIAKDVVDMDEPQRGTRIATQRRIMRRLFEDDQDRLDALKCGGWLLKAFQCLHSSIQGCGAAVCKVRIALIKAILSAEEDLLNIPMDLADHVYEDIYHHLDSASQLLLANDIHVEDLV